MPDDVAINKAAIIERCIARVREEYAGDESNPGLHGFGVELINPIVRVSSSIPD